MAYAALLLLSPAPGIDPSLAGTGPDTGSTTSHIGQIRHLHQSYQTRDLGARLGYF